MDSTESAISFESQLEHQYVATKLLRERIRNFTLRKREKDRATATDALRFGLGEIQLQIESLEKITQQDVLALAAGIKRQKHASVEDMYRLCHAFLQDMENIRTFVGIVDVMQLVIKELTGTDSEKQVMASELFCNLSLGEAPVCDKIANLAGSYLITYLDSTDEYVKSISMWTLANIIATNNEGAAILIQMKLVPKLWNLYTSIESGNSSQFQIDAGICLQLISIYSKNILREEDLQYIAENFQSKNPTSEAAEYHLQIIFNCDIINKFPLNDLQLIYLVNFCLRNLCNTMDFETPSDRLKILFAVRLLANMITIIPNAFNVLLQQVATVWQTNLAILLNKIFTFRKDQLTKETLWLVKNLIEAESKTGSTIMRGQFINNLKICLNHEKFESKNVTT